MEKNEYLHLQTDKDGKIHIDYADGVFTGYAVRDSVESYKAFCEERQDSWLHSNLGNYARFTQKQREEIASRWYKAKEYSNVNLEHYFNFDSKKDIFKSEVDALAKFLGITYELIIK